MTEKEMIQILVEALRASANRNYYDGNYFSDVGLTKRRDGSRAAFEQAEEALRIAYNFQYQSLDNK